MTARTHDLAAITALGGLLIAYPIENVTLATAMVAVLANQIGGIAPDLDQPTAPFWRNLPLFRVFGRFTARIMGGHRFLTHSLLGVALLGFLAKELLVIIHPIMPRVDVDLVWWAFLVGMLSHLIMDSFTKEGVPWLLPIPIKFGVPPLRRMRVTTGKKAEKLLFVGLLGINIWYCAANYTSLVAMLRTMISKG